MYMNWFLIASVRFENGERWKLGWSRNISNLVEIYKLYYEEYLDEKIIKEIKIVLKGK